MTMNAQAAEAHPRSSSPAERMRLHRKRRRRGMRCVKILLDVADIEMLIRKGYLPEDQSEDVEALENAVSDLLFELATYST